MNNQPLYRYTLALSVSTALLAGCSNTATTDDISRSDNQETHPTDLDQINAMDNTATEPMEPISVDPIETRVRFAFDSSQLNDSASASLDALIRMAKQYPASEYSIEIDGHTDSIGTDTYNDQLAAERAESVKGYLEQHMGNTTIKWNIETYGEDQPVASNSTAEGREKNRRADIELNIEVTPDKVASHNSLN